eukprot:XP_011515050.1 integrator complex subunit 4-like protein 1 isoform X3 [Homo sapiens]
MQRPLRVAQGPRPARGCSSADSSRSSSASPLAACAGWAPSALCPTTSPSRRYGPWRFFSIYPIMVELKVIAYLKSTTADVLYPSHSRPVNYSLMTMNKCAVLQSSLSGLSVSSILKALSQFLLLMKKYA